MPCFTERKITVDLTVADQATLIKALEELGYTVNEHNGVINAYRTRGYYTDELRIADGKARVTAGQEGLVQEVHQGYAATAVKTLGKKYGWNFNDVKGEQFHYKAQRRF